MNINLVYEGKDYNFDIPNNVTIDYVKELSSRIFNSDKSLLDLIYNNSKFTERDENILLRDLIPEGENNAVLTVQLNKKMSNKTSKKSSKKKIRDNKDIKENKENDNSQEKEKEKEKEKKIKDYNFINRMKRKINLDQKLNRINENEEKIILNENEEKTSIEAYNKINKGDNIKINDYNIIKKFDSAYSKKNSVLLSLIKEFNNKIKEIYLYLFKKCQNPCSFTPISNSPKNNDSTFHFSSSDTSRSSKNEQNINNNYIYELIIFEKKLINFQENQIQYYLKLLDLLKKYDKDDIMMTLNELFNMLISHNSSNIKIDHLDFIQPLKFKKMASYKLINNNSNSNKFSSLNSLKKKLPFIKSKNSINKSISNISLIENKNTNINNKSIEEINSCKNKIFSKSMIETVDEKPKKSMFSKDKLKMENDNNINNDIKENVKNDIINKVATNVINHKRTYNGIKIDIKNDEKSEKSNNKNNMSNIEEIVSEYNSDKNVINQSPTPQIYRNKTFKPFQKIKFLENNIINIINNNKKKKLDKINHKFNRYNSLSNINQFKFSPNIDKSSKFEEIINNNTKKDFKSNQVTNDLEEYKKKDDEFFPKKSRIKDIDVSSITINTSNFIRDKQILFKKKKRKSISKFDFMI